MKRFFLPFYMLWLREIIRFVRQKNRVFGALGQPILFWLFIGAGLGASFQPKIFDTRIGYMEYFFPGVLLMILLFTAIFSTFSIIEDRNEGFLQGVLVSPSSRLSIVLGKVMGGASIAVLQALLFLIAAPFLGFKFQFLTLLFLSGLLFLVALSLTSFGFWLAWRMDSVQGFHSLMMLILLPMWFLSGAFFPLEGLPSVLAFAMKINPLTYGLAAVRRVLYWNTERFFRDVPSLELSLAVTLLFGVAALFVSWYVVAHRRRNS